VHPQKILLEVFERGGREGGQKGEQIYGNVHFIFSFIKKKRGKKRERSFCGEKRTFLLYFLFRRIHTKNHYWFNKKKEKMIDLQFRPLYTKRGIINWTADLEALYQAGFQAFVVPPPARRPRESERSSSFLQLFHPAFVHVITIRKYHDTQLSLKLAPRVLR